MADRRERYERKQGARERRQQQSRIARRGNFRRTAVMAGGGLTVLVLAVGGFLLFMTTSSPFGKELPPTGYTPAHRETLPTQQINRQPIPRLVQEHVMESDAGHERGSMLVQYNCRNYECGEDLLDKLTAMVSSYPPQVYLAPYPTMDAKIALAAPGKLLLLKAFDEDKIRGFIDANMDR